MSQHQKLLDRFLAKPKDFTWEEFSRLMKGFGYEEQTAGRTGGSRRRFVHDRLDPITLHKPHPRNELKDYQITQVITFLKVHGIL
jgi:hypothetical protein